MPYITKDLLRKKSEHNESMLSTLEEISLHQLDLESMEGIQDYCKHLNFVLVEQPY